MRVNKVVMAAAAMAAMAAMGRAQVLAPAEIREPELKALQEKDLASLRTIANAINGHYFPYHFYCSRALDLEERRQQESDQRSIRFATYRQRTVLQITGNYFASYPGTAMVADQRAERTLKDVMTPIVEAAIPALAGEPKVEALALEVSHHVRRNVLGVTVETPENVVYFLPRAAWAPVAAARTESEREAALMQGALFVNGNAVDGWERQAAAWAPEPKTLAKSKRGRKESADDTMPEAALGTAAAERAAIPAGVQPGTLAAKTVRPAMDMTALTGSAPANEIVGPAAAPAPAVPAASAAPATPAVAVRPAVSGQTLAALVKDLDKDAHFVAYAPPDFMTFHGGNYLQLSFNTTLKEREAGSQYREAALAFDEHVAHLIRGVLGHLPDRTGIDGVDFSTTVRAAGSAAGGEAMSVEYVFPIAALVCYEKYDCTGQQIINQGYVLVNGERIGLELQSAETMLASGAAH